MRGKLFDRPILITLGIAATAVIGMSVALVCNVGETDRVAGRAATRSSTPTPTPELQVGLGSPTLADLGIKLAYARVENTGAGTLVIHPPDGDPVDIAAARGVFTGIAWSPDGQRLAVSFGPSAANQDIYVLNADGTNFTRLTTDGRSKRPTWSPDGETIAFSNSADPAAGPGPIATASAAGGGTTPITGDAAADYASWRPDGSSLAISREPGVVTLVSPTTGAVIQRVELLHDGPLTRSSWVWSMDGTSLAGVTRRGEDYAIVILGDNLTAQRQVGGAFLGTPSDPGWPHPSWTPDGSMIIAASAVTGEIILVSVDATSETMPVNDPTSLAIVLIDPPVGTKLAFPAVSPLPTAGGGAPQVRAEETVGTG